MEQRDHPAASNMSSADQRAADRFGIALPITLEGGEGETHDISETGILFETECDLQVGAQINMTLQYSMDGQEYHLGCEIEVVRVERVDDKFNVAGRLLSPLFSEQ